jgi:hypothetical protein
MKRFAVTMLSLAAVLISPAARAATPWADQVVSYTPGTGIGNDFVTNTPYTDASTTLGEPTRFTSPDSFGGAVTPLQSSYRSNEIVSIGVGGSLVVKFDEPVANDALNPYGIDLLVFGNAFFVGSFFNPDFSFNPAGTAADVAAEGGIVAVSADGQTYFDVSTVADGLFPTNAYVDVTDPFATAAGSVPSNFTLPVDPAFNPNGKTYTQILAGYGASGGGLGIDIGPTGLSSISYVRISNPAGASLIPEIDAFADVAAVPEPAALQIILASALILLGKTARRGNVNTAT